MAAGHDIIVIGASAGGLAPLQRIVADLPPDLPAAVFIVQHVGRGSILPDVLSPMSRLPVAHAVTGERVEHGRIYVAGPGRHLLLHDGHVMLRRGPRENMARPAIDPLFRSAAATFGPRVVGVVLSGALSDGAAGLRAIKRCGGIAVGQDPRDAAVPSMPSSAQRHVDLDHCLPAPSIGPLLVRLAAAAPQAGGEAPLDIRMEAAIAAQELAGMDVEDRLGSPSRFTCPECHGTLWELTDGSMTRYRCHVGHPYTDDAMLTAQGARVEELLWNLMRSNRERAALARRMASDAASPALAAALAARAAGYDEDAALAQQLLGSDEGSADAAMEIEGTDG